MMNKSCKNWGILIGSCHPLGYIKCFSSYGRTDSFPVKILPSLVLPDKLSQVLSGRLAERFIVCPCAVKDGHGPLRPGNGLTKGCNITKVGLNSQDVEYIWLYSLYAVELSCWPNISTAPSCLYFLAPCG